MQATEACKSCRQLLAPGSRSCACGAPTRLASFEERNKWEAKQWRSYKTAQAS